MSGSTRPSCLAARPESSSIRQGAFIASLKTGSQILDVPQTLSDTDVKPGIQATAGTRFFLTPSIAFFTEYKFTHTADFNFSLI